MKTRTFVSPTFDRFLAFKFTVLSLFIIFNLSAAAQEIQPDIRQLTIGVKTERVVFGQADHRYLFELKRGQKLGFSFLEKGANIRALVFRVADKPELLYAANAGKGGFMQETLTMVADQDGVYALFVIAEKVTDQNKEAGYEFTTNLTDSASFSDLQRIQAEKLMLEVVEIVISTDKEKFPLAITKLEEIVKTRRLLGDKYSEATAKMYLGDMYRDTGNLNKSEASYLEALKLFDKTKNKAEIGYVYGSLGVIYLLGKNEEIARQNIEQAREIFSSLGDRQIVKLLSMLSSSNVAESEMGSNNKKLSDYDEELKTALAKNNKPLLASTWAKIIFAYAFDLDAGEKESNSEKNQSPDSSKTAEQILSESGKSLEKKRQLFERAEREGLPLIRQVKDKNAEVQMLVSLGVGYSDLIGDTDDEKTDWYEQKAKNYLIQGLALAKIQNNQTFEILAYGGLYNFYDDDNDKLSIFFGKILINSLQSFRQILKITGDKDFQQNFTRLVEIAYSSIASDLISEDRLPEALQVINLGRDQEFYDFTPFINQPSEGLSLTSREAQNEPLFNNLVNKVIAKYPTASGVLSQLAINELQNDFKLLEGKFPADASESISDAKVNDLDSMKESLRKLEDKTNKKHVTIYFIYEDDEDVLLLLVTPKDIMAFSGNNSDEHVLEFLQLLQSPKDDPRPIAAKIYKDIFEAHKQINKVFDGPNLETELEKYKTDVIHWSLAGKMRYVPVAALYDEKTKQYLVEKYENAIFTRAKKERFLVEPKAWTSGLGFAAPDAPGFEPIPAAKDEITAIFGDSATQQKGYFDGRVFLSRAFTRQSLLAIPQTKPSFVHIASHFGFAPGDAKNSVLVLGDGSTLSLLDLKDSINLFEGVDLLTLSACETGAQREDATGKEVDGLAELAQRLGARSVIATLWEINDSSASTLMAEFYRLNKENPDVSKSEILRIAQLSLLNGKSTWAEGMERRSRGVKPPSTNTSAGTANKESNRIAFTPSTDAKYEHPYYWAPYVFYGSSNGEKTSDYILSKPKSRTQTNNISGGNSGLGGETGGDRLSIAGTWSGKYVCGQGVAGATLKIVQNGNEVQGVFEFYPLPENPTFKPGSGIYKGIYDPGVGVMQLNGERWLSQPDLTWVLVGFSGSFDAERRVYTGKMLRPNCGGIELRKQESSQLIENAPTNQNFGNTPERATVTLKDIESSFKSNLFDETIRLAKIFLQTSAEDKEANAYLGLALLIKKDVDNAVPYLEKAILLGQTIPIPMKRLREPVFGHDLNDVTVVVSKTYVEIASGNTVFRAKFTDLTEANALNYDNQCQVVHLKGNFTESSSKSEKSKQDKKQFNLFPPNAYLQQRQQGKLILNFAACTNENNYLSTAVMNLISRLASK